MSLKLNVANIHCNSCAKKITDAILAVEPGARVDIDIHAGTVGVEPVADKAAITKAIENAGYTIQSAA